jgi:hypothetical protein
VPGTTAGLEAVHRAYGRLPWAEVIAPAIELAREGVELSRPQAHLHAILDLILRHTAEGRRLYSGRTGRSPATPAPVRPRWTLAHRDGGPRSTLTTGARAATVGGGGATAGLALTGSSGAGRFVSFSARGDLNPPPSSGGILIFAARAARTLAAEARECGGTRHSRSDARADAARAGRSRGLHRGGLAALLADESHSRQRPKTGSLPGRASTRPQAARRTSPRSMRETLRRSPRRPARAPACRAEHRHPAQQLLGETTWSGPPAAGRLTSMMAPRRRWCQQPAARGRWRVRRPHGAIAEVVNALAHSRRWTRRSTIRACTSTGTSLLRRRHDAGRSTGWRLGYDVVRWRRQPLRRRRSRCCPAASWPQPATPPRRRRRRRLADRPADPGSAAARAALATAVDRSRGIAARRGWSRGVVEPKRPARCLLGSNGTIPPWP